MEIRYDDPNVRYDSGIYYQDSSAPAQNGSNMAKVKLNSGTLTPDEKVVQGNTIKTAMTGNADFPTPNPSLAAFGTVINTLATKQANYLSLVEQTKAALEERNTAVTDYDASARQLATYAENVTNGDAAKLHRGGFETRNASQPIGPLGEVLGLVLKTGLHDGELKARWKPLRGAKSYEVQISADPFGPTTWRSVEPSPKSYCTLTGLTSGTKIWVRVRGIGKGPAGNWCDPATRFVA